MTASILQNQEHMIDFELTDEQRLIRETARDFADGEIVPRARENDRNEHFDTELVQKIADMGFLGAIVPEEYGGRGVDYRTYALIVEEIGRGCSAMRTVVSVVTSLVCSPSCGWGSEEQKQEWLPQLCSGEAIGCLGLTEPTRARRRQPQDAREGGGRQVAHQRGQEWISLGNYSKLGSFSRRPDPAKKHKGLLIPGDDRQPGFNHPGDPSQARPEGLDTAELALDDVEGDLMGEVGDGFKLAMSALDSGQLQRGPPAAWASARARWTLDLYSKERTQFERPIGSFQLVQEISTEMVVQTRGGTKHGLARRLAQGPGQASTTETSIAKL